MGGHGGRNTRPKKVRRVEESAAREETAKHRMVGDTHKKFPNFFQIYLSEFRSERMPIPRAFVCCLKGAIPKKTILRNNIGQCWDVEVEKTEEGVFFEHGWKPFHKANSIRNGELLVFQYNGSVFDCSIYGLNLCERTIPPSREKRKGFVAVKEENEDVDPDDGESGLHVPSDDYHDDGEAGEELDGEDDDGDDHDHDGGQAVEEADDEDGDYHEDEEMEEEFEDDDPDDDDHDDDDGEAEEEAGGEDEEGSGYMSPKNLSFEVEWMPGTKRKKLHVPSDLIEDYNIKLHDTMIFQDPRERKWLGEVSVWGDGRVWIGGWKQFCNKNDVKQGDKCICKLVLDNEGHRCTGYDCIHTCEKINVQIVRNVD